jgi:hypothetical protein
MIDVGFIEILSRLGEITKIHPNIDSYLSLSRLIRIT